MPNSPRLRFCLAGLGLAAVLAGPAAAQLLPGGMPGGLPNLPGSLGAPLDRPLGGVPELRSPADEARRLSRSTADLALGAAGELRRTAARRLIRAYPWAVDVDDRGEPVVRDEVTAVAPSAEGLQTARALGFSIRQDTALPGLDLRIVVLRPPSGLDLREAVRRLRSADPAGQYDFDHIYLPSGSASRLSVLAAGPGGAAKGGPSARIGLVDGGVAAHRSLASADIEQRGFAPGGAKPSAHGTAVASLLAGRDGAFRGAAPGARLLAADVYGAAPSGGSAVLIAQALSWLAEARVPVVCISLVGPSNAVLQAAVQALVARGILLVAPVGNDGPAAPPLYPASYPGVVAVTGVDARRRVLPEAGRGSHVDFAAPGADMAAAALGGGYVPVRGTSFAAPLVAGRLAALAGAPGDGRRALAALGAEAADLGAPGPDPVYGRGLVAFDLRLPPGGLAGR